MSSTSRFEDVQDLEIRTPAPRAGLDGPASAGTVGLSAQAVRLHAYGVIAVIRGDSGGLLGRAEADRLAVRAGALVDELVEAGLWIETDVSYVVRVDALGEALREA